MMTTVHDFISPFDLKNCKSRLSNRTEKTSWMASRYARRTQVDVWDINNYTAGFKIYKAPRSAIQISTSVFSQQVTGKLQHRPDGSGTLVIYEIRQHPIGIIGEWVLAVLLSVLVVLMLHNQLYDTYLSSLALGVFLIALGISFSTTYFYRQYTQSELLGIVRKALGDLDTM